ncbi:MAG: lysozyme [Myxococcales bacterium]|jgi:lysozyme|nr:lysozyme [Myxococcales bacterium]
MPVLGIDVSHHNGPVDWFAVSGSDVKFAFAKATEGNSLVDPQFDANWKGMGNVGLLRGAYHFARPGGDPEIQAAHFASTVGPRSFGGLPPALDLETDGGLPPAQVVQWTLAFLARAEALFGRPLIIYTGGLWRRTLKDPDVPQLRDRWLWTARYGSNQPVVPRTWARWDIWQFTDGESGAVQRIPGISGPCDCDRFRGDLPELQALANQAAAPTPAPPIAATPVDPARPPFGGRFLVWPCTPMISGDDVRVWQTRMRERGFAVDVDGFYGRQSRQACIALQREMGIEPDGIVGGTTWNATFDADT